MGSYLNPGSFSFRGSLRSKIYVDKSELIAKINEVLYTEQKYICVSRPRRLRNCAKDSTAILRKLMPGTMDMNW